MGLRRASRSRWRSRITALMLTAVLGGLSAGCALRGRQLHFPWTKQVGAEIHIQGR